MTAFMAAYVVVWLGVVLFVSRMGIRQKRLQQSLDTIQTRWNGSAREHQSKDDTNDQQSSAESRAA